jgi:hypothetical protein
LKRFGRRRQAWAEQNEWRLDELTLEFIELAQLNRSGVIGASEFLERETALREEFDDLVAGLERGTKRRLPQRPTSPVRVIPGN